MAVATPSRLSTTTASLVRTIWDTKLYKESLFRDIFSGLRTIFDGRSSMDAIQIPNSVIMEFPHPSSYRTGRLGFINALQGTPREGNLQQQLTNEETLRTKGHAIHYNDFSHAVTGWQYGIDRNDASAYGLYGKNLSYETQLLADHAQELFGFYTRQRPPAALHSEPDP